MKNYAMNFLLAVMLPAVLLCAGCSRTVVTTSNPVIYGDVPDPDIIRVGDDYYMTSTTMHLLPIGRQMLSAATVLTTTAAGTRTSSTAVS